MSVVIFLKFRFYKNEDEFVKIGERIKLGDIIGVRGQPCRTKTGELSIRPEEITILTPCLKQMPTMHYGLKDKVNNNNWHCTSLQKKGSNYNFHFVGDTIPSTLLGLDDERRSPPEVRDKGEDY